jgi:DNA-binding SARP family transcriptional activator
MDFRILGTLQVYADSRELCVAGGKLRSLLAILLVQANRAVSEDALIEGLWGDAPSPRAADNLHVLVSRLRGVLGKDRVVRDGNGYFVRVEEGELDLDRFQELRRTGEPGKALELWRGPALADFVYERWAEREARRLDELRLVAFEERIEVDLDAGRAAELVPELQALVAEEPLRETLRRHLIVALYQSGRQAEALEAYHEARRMLDEELGLEPGPELRELELAVLRHDPSLQAPAKVRRVAAVLRGRRSRAAVLTTPLALLGGFLAALTAIHVLDQGAHGRRTLAAAAPKLASTVEVRRFVPTTNTRRVVFVRERSRVAPKEAPSRPVAQSTQKTHSPEPRSRPPRRELASRSSKPKPRPPAHVPAPSVYWLVDNFEDPAFDFGLWHIAGHGRGMDVGERNGKLEFSVASEVQTDGDRGVDQHYGTGCRLAGDFDARVEFELLEWPERNGMSVTFGAYFPAPDEAFLSISRAPEGYSASVASIERSSEARDSKGTLRLRRQNGVLTMYYRSLGLWVELAGGYAPGPANLILGFNTNADQFGHQAARAAFDNFAASSTGVSCAGYPLPPYKPAAIAV